MSEYTICFQGRSEYIVAPSNPDTAHDLVAIRHSAFVSPWIDPDVHAHGHSEECYILLHGELLLLVDGSLTTLKSREILLVKPHVPQSGVHLPCPSAGRQGRMLKIEPQ